MRTQLIAERIGGEAVDLVATKSGDLRIAQYLPPYAQLCAAGKIFAADTQAATAVSTVNSAVTTSPEWMVYNANEAGGPSLIMILAFCYLESGTAGLGLSLLAASALGVQTVVSAHASSAIITCLDGTAKVPAAYMASNPTLLGGTPSWVAIASYDQIASNGVGEGLVARVDGLFIAPPKGGLCLEVLGEAGSTDKFDVGMVFAEVQLD